MDTTQNLSNYNDGGYKVVVVAAILIFMQTLMVCGRLVSRYMQKASLAADDYALFVATTMGVGLCGLGIVFPRIAAYGPHIEMIQLASEAEGRSAGQSFVAWMVLYGFSIAASKCAILLLYMRVFTSRMRLFTALCYIMGFVIVATCIANTLVAIFSCSPVAFAWDKSIPGGKCIDEIAFARFMSIPNVVTGAIMLVMPLPLVWQLKVPIAAKIALTATFLHGIIGFVASCARLSILFLPTPTTPSALNTTALAWTIWTLNEPANYVIAACLPTLRPIFVRVLPASFFLLSRGSSGGGKRSYTSKDLKVSWPSGKLTPTFRLETRSRVAMTDSRLSGPWNRTMTVGGGSEERIHGIRGEKDGGVVYSERERLPTPDEEMGRGLEEKGGILVESSIEVGTRRAASLL